MLGLLPMRSLGSVVGEPGDAFNNPLRYTDPSGYLNHPSGGGGGSDDADDSEEEDACLGGGCSGGPVGGDALSNHSNANELLYSIGPLYNPGASTTVDNAIVCPAPTTASGADAATLPWDPSGSVVATPSDTPSFRFGNPLAAAGAEAFRDAAKADNWLEGAIGYGLGAFAYIAALPGGLFYGVLDAPGELYAGGQDVAAGRPGRGALEAGVGVLGVLPMLPLGRVLGEAGTLALEGEEAVGATASAVRGAETALAERASSAATTGGAPKPFAMGLTDEGLEAFASARGATTWKQLPDPANWRSGVLEKLADPSTQVHFNLDGVDVWQGLTRAASGRGGPTDWELLTIRQNPQFWDTLQFWRGGQPVANPFQ